MKTRRAIYKGDLRFKECPVFELNLENGYFEMLSDPSFRYEAHSVLLDPNFLVFEVEGDEVTPVVKCQQHDYNYAKLIEILNFSPLIKKVLLTARVLGLRNYYIGAGCIAQTVWNQLFDKPFGYGIKDIDLVYFDAENLDFESENKMIHQIKEAFKSVELEVDVKNQARVHLWYPSKFGKEIEPYANLEAAIDSWPTTATAIGVRLEENDELTIYAPYGLADLFAGTVRANKLQITEEIYEAKAKAWKFKWPELETIPW